MFNATPPFETVYHLISSPIATKFAIVGEVIEQKT